MKENNISEFKEKGYTLVKNAVDKKLVSLVSKYALIDEKNDFSLEDGKHPQIHNSHSQYGDGLMDALLLELQPLMEEHTGLTLYPTYSYYRVYRPGAILKKHKDRPSCEISTTVTFEYNYQDSDYSWPIFVEGTKCTMQPGDLVIYRGCDLDHWRDEFMAPEGSYHIQVFLHYVDAHGPYPDWKFDRRPYIGFDKEGNYEKMIARALLPFKEYISFVP